MNNDSLWLCLRFPLLPLAAVADPHTPQPLATIERQRLHTLNTAAARAGLLSGMGLSNGYALCPALIALERQPEREVSALQQLACWAYGLVQEVALADDNSLLLEVGSCRRLYGGIEPLLQRLELELEQRQQPVQAGLASTPKAAWLLAQAEPVGELQTLRPSSCSPSLQLAELPVAHLPLGTKVSTALTQTGIHTVGALLALPRAALGKRFGAAFTRYLAQLTGEMPDPQPGFVPPPVFSRTLSFLDGIHDRQILLFPIKRLIGELCDYLRARQLLCRQLVWRFHDAHHPQGELVIALSQSQNRASVFLELSRLRLDQLELPEPVFLLELASDAFDSVSENSLDLFGDSSDADSPSASSSHTGHAQQAELLDRLAARLGDEALQRLWAVEQHWPESAGRCLGLHQIASVAAATQTPSGPRPLWLLPEPRPLPCRDGKPCWDQPLQLVRGPERIDPSWWQEATTIRDYYEARRADGSRCWVFRVTDAQSDAARWFLHGLFA